MTTFDLYPELAERLDGIVPAEAPTGDWDDVLQRVRPSRFLRRRILGVKLAIALAVFLLLVGIASATYVLLHHAKSVEPTPGALTYTADGHCRCRYAKVEEVVPDAPPRVVWHCPGNRFCGTLTSVDWSPDGRHVALTLDTFQSASPYLGLHIVDVTTGRDIHVLPRRVIGYADRFPRRPLRRPICVSPTQVAWSPDGRTLAFGCGSGRIYTVRSDGTVLRILPTGIVATRPSWSPDGTRIAFSGKMRGRGHPWHIYVMRVDGSHRTLIVLRGDAPDWSPDGKTIAYRSPNGVAFVTPSGAPSSRKPLRIRGVPSWSSDGSRLAIEATSESVYVAQAGRDPVRATPPVDGPFAWYPTKASGSTPRHSQTSTCGAC
jgi:dipeptidyl aminopeptidase/acylaminoacyl peptidase